MNTSFKEVSKQFDRELQTIASKKSAIIFLVNNVNTYLKKAKYDQAHSILGYARLKYMKREAQELSNIEKLRITKIQLQRAIIFMAQKNQGGAKLMISIAANMLKKLGKNSPELEDLKKISEKENANDIVVPVLKDDRFDLNNLSLAVKLLVERAALTAPNVVSSQAKLEKHPLMTLEIKAYQSDNN